MSDSKLIFENLSITIFVRHVIVSSCMFLYTVHAIIFYLLLHLQTWFHSCLFTDVVLFMSICWLCSAHVYLQTLFCSCLLADFVLLVSICRLRSARVYLQNLFCSCLFADFGLLVSIFLNLPFIFHLLLSPADLRAARIFYQCKKIFTLPIFLFFTYKISLLFTHADLVLRVSILLILFFEKIIMVLPLADLVLRVSILLILFFEKIIMVLPLQTLFCSCLFGLQASCIYFLTLYFLHIITLHTYLLFPLVKFISHKSTGFIVYFFSISNHTFFKQRNIHLSGQIWMHHSKL